MPCAARRPRGGPDAPAAHAPHAGRRRALPTPARRMPAPAERTLRPQGSPCSRGIESGQLSPTEGAPMDLPNKRPDDMARITTPELAEAFID